MKLGASHYLAVLFTLVVAGGVTYWAWNGMKAPPVREPTVSIVTTPAGWKKLDAGPFTFYAPKYAMLRQLREPDHAVGQLIGAIFYLHYEFGTPQNTLVEKDGARNFSESETVIDGRRAILRKATLGDEAQQARFGSYAQPSYIGLYIPEAVRQVGPDGKERWYALRVEAGAVNDDERDLVEVMFKSIRFAKER